jgi:hypothetical protein
MSFLKRLRFGQKGEQNVEVATPQEVESKPGEIRRVILPDTLVKFMKQDFERRAPEEFAFLASGVITPEGVGIISSYYGGELDETSPVHCTLKESFISRVLYDDLPKTHNLIVWGHFHPISGPSGTDSRSLNQLNLFFSKFDKRKPVGLLFDTTNMVVTCYSGLGASIPNELLEFKQIRPTAAVGRITCPKCGTNYLQDARFCDRCGEPLQPQNPGVDK